MVSSLFFWGVPRCSQYFNGDPLILSLHLECQAVESSITLVEAGWLVIMNDGWWMTRQHLWCSWCSYDPITILDSMILTRSFAFMVKFDGCRVSRSFDVHVCPGNVIYDCLLYTASLKQISNRLKDNWAASNPPHDWWVLQYSIILCLNQWFCSNFLCKKSKLVC